MSIPSFKEDLISQLPALHLLQNVGYSYLTPEQALEYRSGRFGNVLLENILEAQLHKINSIWFKGKEHRFTDNNIRQGIQALRDVMYDGLVRTNEKIFDLLTLGKSLEQTIDGDKKSFTLQYIDWEHIENNVFHITEEFAVERSGSTEKYIPDLVLFVNGIPFCVIECKRPDSKDPIDEAKSQFKRNQRDDGIPKLFTFAQLLVAISKNEAYYATVDTPPKFWAIWKEDKDVSKEVSTLINKPLAEPQKKALFRDRAKYVEQYFRDLEGSERKPTEQDKAIYCLCRPERLLELTREFIVFDAGEKKVARYQQYFAVKNSIARVETVDTDGKRAGGVIWHTQGSGKSLTMVMLTKAIALHKQIRNPKIIVVTDRIELDEQIEGNFANCGIEVVRADTGAHLINLLKEEKAQIITTVINKFESVLARSDYKNPSPDIFVLVDESHRTQYGVANARMQKVFPKGCYIGFTGTPILKKDKNTIQRFGGFIDRYTIDQAVADKAVVPLLYEGRLVFQDVNEKSIDTWFEKLSSPLTPEQKKTIKRRFSSNQHLNATEQKIRCVAYDASLHFKNNWQGSGFKGQITVPTKASAILYKKYFDECGLVSTEVLISPPDMREGYEQTTEDKVPEVQAFWKRMMDRFGNSDTYDRQLRNLFKNNEDPEIIIVVDKLLTGFDNPKNVVLYIAQSLKEHSLLQAIARVNRLCEGKEYGYIIDYFGVLGRLDEALNMYSAFADFDDEDIAGTLTDISKVVSELPQKHSDLWDVFKEVSNKKDLEEYELLLGDAYKREVFRTRLSAFARTLGVALSSLEFNLHTPEEKINDYRRDLVFFENLRKTVIQRYSDDKLDYKEYSKKIEGLLNTYVTADEVKPTTPLVNIFDKDSFERVLKDCKTSRSKAETILNRTKKTISEKYDEDPEFYERFSKLIEKTLVDYRQKRIDEADLLSSAVKHMESVRTRTGDDTPEALKTRDVAKAFYGVTMKVFEGKEDLLKKEPELAVDIALHIDDVIKEKLRVDWVLNSDVQNNMKNSIEQYLYHLQDTKGLTLSFDEMDSLIDKSINIAKTRYAQ